LTTASPRAKVCTLGRERGIFERASRVQTRSSWSSSSGPRRRWRPPAVAERGRDWV